MKYCRRESVVRHLGRELCQVHWDAQGEGDVVL